MCGEGEPQVQLKDFGAALLRRWYLVVFSIVCAAATVFVAVYAVGPTYKTQASVLLLPPGTTVQRNSESTGVGNPWLSLGGVSQARDVVIRALMASTTMETLCQQPGDEAYEAMRAALCRSSPEVSFEVTQDYISSAPMILITVEADSPANAVTAVNAVADLVPTTLSDLQAALNLRSRALITSMPVVIDQNPEAVHKDQIRAGIVAGGGTLGVALLLIGLIDGLLAARRARQEQVVSDAPEEEIPAAEPAEAPGWGAEPAEASPGWGAEPAEASPGWGWQESDDDETADESADDQPRSVTPLRKKPAPVAEWDDAMAANQ
jgi:hypothetical protein